MIFTKLILLVQQFTKAETEKDNDLANANDGQLSEDGESLAKCDVGSLGASRKFVDLAKEMKGFLIDYKIKCKGSASCWATAKTKATSALNGNCSFASALLKDDVISPEFHQKLLFRCNNLSLGYSTLESKIDNLTNHKLNNDLHLARGRLVSHAFADAPGYDSPHPGMGPARPNPSPDYFYALARDREMAIDYLAKNLNAVINKLESINSTFSFEVIQMLQESKAAARAMANGLAGGPINFQEVRNRNEQFIVMNTGNRQLTPEIIDALRFGPHSLSGAVEEFNNATALAKHNYLDNVIEEQEAVRQEILNESIAHKQMMEHKNSLLNNEIEYQNELTKEIEISVENVERISAIAEKHITSANAEAGSRLSDLAKAADLLRTNNDTALLEFADKTVTDTLGKAEQMHRNIIHNNPLAKNSIINKDLLEMGSSNTNAAKRLKKQAMSSDSSERLSKIEKLRLMESNFSSEKSSGFDESGTATKHFDEVLAEIDKICMFGLDKLNYTTAANKEIMKACRSGNNYSMISPKTMKEIKRKLFGKSKDLRHKSEILKEIKKLCFNGVDSYKYTQATKDDVKLACANGLENAKISPGTVRDIQKRLGRKNRHKPDILKEIKKICKSKIFDSNYTDEAKLEIEDVCEIGITDSKITLETVSNIEKVLRNRVRASNYPPGVLIEIEIMCKNDVDSSKYSLETKNEIKEACAYGVQDSKISHDAVGEIDDVLRNKFGPLSSYLPEVSANIIRLCEIGVEESNYSTNAKMGIAAMCEFGIGSPKISLDVLEELGDAARKSAEVMEYEDPVRFSAEIERMCTLGVEKFNHYSPMARSEIKNVCRHDIEKSDISPETKAEIKQKLQHEFMRSNQIQKIVERVRYMDVRTFEKIFGKFSGILNKTEAMSNNEFEQFKDSPEFSMKLNEMNQNILDLITYETENYPAPYQANISKILNSPETIYKLDPKTFEGLKQTAEIVSLFLDMQKKEFEHWINLYSPELGSKVHEMDYEAFEKFKHTPETIGRIKKMDRKAFRELITYFTPESIERIKKMDLNAVEDFRYAPAESKRVNAQNLIDAPRKTGKTSIKDLAIVPSNNRHNIKASAIDNQHIIAKTLKQSLNEAEAAIIEDGNQDRFKKDFNHSINEKTDARLENMDRNMFKKHFKYSVNSNQKTGYDPIMYEGIETMDLADFEELKYSYDTLKMIEYMDQNSFEIFFALPQITKERIDKMDEKAFREFKFSPETFKRVEQMDQKEFKRFYEFNSKINAKIEKMKQEELKNLVKIDAAANDMVDEINQKKLKKYFTSTSETKQLNEILDRQELEISKYASKIHKELGKISKSKILQLFGAKSLTKESISRMSQEEFDEFRESSELADIIGNMLRKSSFPGEISEKIEKMDRLDFKNFFVDSPSISLKIEKMNLEELENFKFSSEVARKIATMDKKDLLRTFNFSLGTIAEIKKMNDKDFRKFKYTPLKESKFYKLKDREIRDNIEDLLDVLYDMGNKKEYFPKRLPDNVDKTISLEDEKFHKKHANVNNSKIAHKGDIFHSDNKTSDQRRDLENVLYEDLPKIKETINELNHTSKMLYHSLSDLTGNTKDVADRKKDFIYPLDQKHYDDKFGQNRQELNNNIADAHLRDKLLVPQTDLNKNDHTRNMEILHNMENKFETNARIDIMEHLTMPHSQETSIRIDKMDKLNALETSERINIMDKYLKSEINAKINELDLLKIEERKKSLENRDKSSRLYSSDTGKRISDMNEVSLADIKERIDVMTQLVSEELQSRATNVGKPPMSFSSILKESNENTVESSSPEVENTVKSNLVEHNVMVNNLEPQTSAGPMNVKLENEGKSTKLDSSEMQDKIERIAKLDSQEQSLRIDNMNGSAKFYSSETNNRLEKIARLNSQEQDLRIRMIDRSSPSSIGQMNNNTGEKHKLDSSEMQDKVERIAKLNSQEQSLRIEKMQQPSYSQSLGPTVENVRSAPQISSDAIPTFNSSSSKKHGRLDALEKDVNKNEDVRNEKIDRSVLQNTTNTGKSYLSQMSKKSNALNYNNKEDIKFKTENTDQLGLSILENMDAYPEYNDQFPKPHSSETNSRINAMDRVSIAKTKESLNNMNQPIKSLSSATNLRINIMDKHSAPYSPEMNSRIDRIEDLTSTEMKDASKNTEGSKVSLKMSKNNEINKEQDFLDQSLNLDYERSMNQNHQKEYNDNDGKKLGTQYVDSSMLQGEDKNVPNFIQNEIFDNSNHLKAEIKSDHAQAEIENSNNRILEEKNNARYEEEKRSKEIEEQEIADTRSIAFQNVLNLGGTIEQAKYEAKKAEEFKRKSIADQKIESIQSAKDILAPQLGEGQAMKEAIHMAKSHTKRYDVFDKAHKTSDRSNGFVNDEMAINVDLDDNLGVVKMMNDNVSEIIANNTVLDLPFSRIPEAKAETAEEEKIKKSLEDLRDRLRNNVTKNKINSGLVTLSGIEGVLNLPEPCKEIYINKGRVFYDQRGYDLMKQENIDVRALEHRYSSGDSLISYEAEIKDMKMQIPSYLNINIDQNKLYNEFESLNIKHARKIEIANGVVKCKPWKRFSAEIRPKVYRGNQNGIEDIPEDAKNDYQRIENIHNNLENTKVKVVMNPGGKITAEIEPPYGVKSKMSLAEAIDQAKSFKNVKTLNMPGKKLHDGSNEEFGELSFMEVVKNEIREANKELKHMPATAGNASGNISYKDEYQKSRADDQINKQLQSDRSKLQGKPDVLGSQITYARKADSILAEVGEESSDNGGKINISEYKREGNDKETKAFNLVIENHRSIAKKLQLNSLDFLEQLKLIDAKTVHDAIKFYVDQLQAPEKGLELDKQMFFSIFKGVFVTLPVSDVLKSIVDSISPDLLQNKTKLESQRHTEENHKALKYGQNAVKSPHLLSPNFSKDSSVNSKSSNVENAFNVFNWTPRNLDLSFQQDFLPRKPASDISNPSNSMEKRLKSSATKRGYSKLSNPQKINLLKNNQLNASNQVIIRLSPNPTQSNLKDNSVSSKTTSIINNSKFKVSAKNQLDNLFSKPKSNRLLPNKTFNPGSLQNLNKSPKTKSILNQNANSYFRVSANDNVNQKTAQKSNQGPQIMQSR